MLLLGPVAMLLSVSGVPEERTVPDHVVVGAPVNAAAAPGLRGTSRRQRDGVNSEVSHLEHIMRDVDGAVVEGRARSSPPGGGPGGRGRDANKKEGKNHRTNRANHEGVSTLELGPEGPGCCERWFR